MRSLLFFVLLLFPSFSFSQTPYADFLVQKAEELRLYEDGYWLLLGHYKRSFGGYKSQIDDKTFFLAKDGKKNPRAELEATLRAFFRPKEEGVDHPTYTYTSRYKWLCSVLDIDKSQLPYDGDQSYRAVWERIKPSAVYLVFPAGYMNDPASIFGHLFFLIESEGVPHLAGLSVNYGAIATDPPGVLYAIKGLFGAYPGRYDMIPYYSQITKYSYLDMRDTWEYKLLLTEDENDSLLRHIIEMASAYANYYFLDENCAYCLLFPIEVARPDTKLTDTSGLFVEPLHTVQRLQEKGLLGEAQYRPSLFSKMKYEKSFLTAKQKSFVKKVCKGKISPSAFPFADMTAEEQANLWEFASDYLKYLLSNDKITQTDYQKRFVAVLSERNKLGRVPSLAQNIPIPAAQPQKAHGSRQFALGGGFIDGDGYAEARFRLLAHSLMDTGDGYSPNSQLEFFTGAVRYTIPQKEFSLRYADVMHIISLPLTDTFVFKKAFHFRTGLASNLNEDGDEDLAWRLKLTVGVSSQLSEHTQAYLLAGADAYFSSAYDYYTDAFGGGELGFITTAGSWKQKLFASVFQSPFDSEHTRFEAGAEERLAFSQNFSLNAHYRFMGDWRQTWHEGGCSLRLSF